MQIIDFILIIFLLLGLYAGYRQGFVAQIFSIIGLIVGFMVAKQFYIELTSQFLKPYIDSEAISNVISFSVIWLVVTILTGLVGNLFSGLLDKISLGWLNRLIGSIIGGLKYLFLLSLIIGIFDSIDSKNQVLSKKNKEQSLLYNPTKKIASNLYDLIKEQQVNIKKRINNIDINI